MNEYTHLHRRASGTERRQLTSVNASLVADVLIRSRVLGQPGNWRAQLSLGDDLTIHPFDADSLRRFAAAALQLAEDWEQVLADDGPPRADGEDPA